MFIIRFMVEVLQVVLSVLVVACLVTIAGYFLAFFAVVGWTLWRGGRDDPREKELDAYLAGLLGPHPREKELDAYLAGLLGPHPREKEFDAYLAGLLGPQDDRGPQPAEHGAPGHRFLRSRKKASG